MENKISENYSKTMQRIIEGDGLISMGRIYEDYGRPKYKSPKRYVSYKRTKEQIQYAIKQSGYHIEQVIQYTPEDILISGTIAMMYLNQLDVESYYHYYYGENGIFNQGVLWLDLFDKWCISD